MVVLSIFLLISTISPISANKNNNRNRNDDNKSKGTTRAPTRTPVRPVALVTPRPTRATTKNPYLKFLYHKTFVEKLNYFLEK